MCKITKIISKKQRNCPKFSFSLKKSLKTEVNIGSASLSGIGGALLLRETERRREMAYSLASCIKDNRRQSSVRHSYEEMIRMSIFLKCLGYQDCNDCDAMRKDPMLCASVSPEEMNDLCSQATMTRLENAVTEEDLLRLQEMFVTLFVMSYDKEPEEIILDCDDTNINTHGCQELTLWNTYYDSTCYMPLLIFEGYSGKMILPLLRPGRGNKAANICDTLQWLIMTLRQTWKKTRIIVRGDSHFCSDEFMEWADSENASSDKTRLFYITGLAQNNVLNTNKIVCLESAWARKLYQKNHEPLKLYNDFFYKAGSWSYAHHVVVKVEYTATSSSANDQNIRYVVTNICDIPERIYTYWYCQRGCDELYIKEFKEAVNACRMSCHTFNANRFRIFMFAAAYTVLHALREEALKGTRCEDSTLLSIREDILRCPVSVRILKTKIVIDFSVHNPKNDVIEHAMRFYERLLHVA